MQAQAVVHDEPDGNVLSRGEGTPSLPATRRKAQATRRKRL